MLPILPYHHTQRTEYADEDDRVSRRQIEPFYFAAIGAAVFMGVIMQLPLTALILSLETTFDYNVVVATGITVVITSYLSGLSFDIRRRQSTRAEKIDPKELQEE